MEIEHEIISVAILLPSPDSRGVVVSYKRKYVQEVLVNRLVKLAQEKVWLGELTILIKLLTGMSRIKSNPKKSACTSMDSVKFGQKYEV